MDGTFNKKEVFFEEIVLLKLSTLQQFDKAIVKENITDNYSKDHATSYKYNFEENGRGGNEYKVHRSVCIEYAKNDELKNLLHKENCIPYNADHYHSK